MTVVGGWDASTGRRSRREAVMLERGFDGALRREPEFDNSRPVRRREAPTNATAHRGRAFDARSEDRNRLWRGLRCSTPLGRLGCALPAGGSPCIRVFPFLLPAPLGGIRPPRRANGPAGVCPGSSLPRWISCRSESIPFPEPPAPFAARPVLTFELRGAPLVGASP